MASDVHERLADYRTSLDDAIARDLATRPHVADHAQRSGRRVLLATSAVVILAAGVGALVWTGVDRHPAPSSSQLADQTATTINDSVVAVESQPSIAPSTVVPIPSETQAPTAVIDRLAIGDAVMLGAASELIESGFTVDAMENRAFLDGLETLRTLNAQGRLGDIVIVHLGTNGPIQDSDISQMLDALAGVRQALLVTSNVDRDYTAGNNRLIFDAAVTNPNVSVLDWAGLSDSCPGACFYDDGFHLRPDGQRYYANLINASIDGSARAACSAPGDCDTYIVQPGDYPAGVAHHFCITVADLIEANDWADHTEFPGPEVEIVVPRPAKSAGCPDPTG